MRNLNTYLRYFDIVNQIMNEYLWIIHMWFWIYVYTIPAKLGQIMGVSLQHRRKSL